MNKIVLVGWTTKDWKRRMKTGDYFYWTMNEHYLWDCVIKIKITIEGKKVIIEEEKK